MMLLPASNNHTGDVIVQEHDSVFRIWIAILCFAPLLLQDPKFMSGFVVLTFDLILISITTLSWSRNEAAMPPARGSNSVAGHSFRPLPTFGSATHPTRSRPFFPP